MTDAELVAIKERCEAATEGPWEVGRGSPPIPGSGDSRTVGVDGGKAIAVLVGMQLPSYEGNAIFIAHARSDIPALLSLVEEQRAWFQRYKDAGGFVTEAERLTACAFAEGIQR